ncbi:hypothetical protein E1165_25610 [Micromonospora sp. KC723]|nr:hypothetical protein E1165_25610 [Micromonospora sp. KC723]
MARPPRRSLLSGAAITGAAGQSPPLASPAAGGSAHLSAADPPRTRHPDAAVPLRSLDSGAPPTLVGANWGMPWRRGTLARGHRSVQITEELRAVNEVNFVSTDADAQSGLAAIQCLAQVGDQLPREGNR